ncbi:MAG: hypothetical protein FRX48_09526 [Lasallia pustulata]|uniref:Uncharacterized protein n=1 Tax=Lasallia pustulata TaxID=136370 RepID=A0A5M8PDH3_9LECA|nr:MAG: hypothetical protein FRX48_09526 [Lasallia pustulata]
MKSAISLAAVFLLASAQANPQRPRTQSYNDTAPILPPGSNATVPLFGPCTPGAFGCNTRYTFSQCVPTAGGSTAYIYFGSVPAGMICQNGQIVRDTLGPCSPPGSLQCLNGGRSFGLCDQSGLIYMGIVAAGTVCENGSIVAA